MPVSLYDTRALMGVIEDLYEPSTFLLDTFFGTEMTFDTEKIDFDKIMKGRKRAPIVSPLVKGRPMRSRAQTTESYAPAYIKPKDHVDPNQPMKRRPGERYLGDGATPGERREAIIAEILLEHQEALDLRLESMAAEAILNGSITVEGDDFPAQLVDFQRDAALTVILLTSARWGEAGVSPSASLQAWATLTGLKGRAPVTDVVMDSLAFELLAADPKVNQTLLDSLRGSESRLELGPDARLDVQFKGMLGNLNVWVYIATYEDDAGVEVPFIPDYTVCMLSRRIDGVQAFGAIKNAHANYRALRSYPSNFIDNDPPIEFVMTESSPLIVPARPNLSFRATVR